MLIYGLNPLHMGYCHNPWTAMNLEFGEKNRNMEWHQVLKNLKSLFFVAINGDFSSRHEDVCRETIARIRSHGKWENKPARTVVSTKNDAGWCRYGPRSSKIYKGTPCQIDINWPSMLLAGSYSPLNGGTLGLDSQILAPEVGPGGWFVGLSPKCVIDFITIQKTMVSGECCSILGGWDC